MYDKYSIDLLNNYFQNMKPSDLTIENDQNTYIGKVTINDMIYTMKLSFRPKEDGKNQGMVHVHELLIKKDIKDSFFDCTVTIHKNVCDEYSNYKNKIDIIMKKYIYNDLIEWYKIYNKIFDEEVNKQLESNNIKMKDIEIEFKKCENGTYIFLVEFKNFLNKSFTSLEPKKIEEINKEFLNFLENMNESITKEEKEEKCLESSEEDVLNCPEETEETEDIANMIISNKEVNKLFELNNIKIEDVKIEIQNCDDKYICFVKFNYTDKLFLILEPINYSELYSKFIEFLYAELTSREEKETQ